MKTLQLFLLGVLFTITANDASAQAQKTETFKVAGNCGMCKATIEKSAKACGASFAEWNKDEKILTVKYKSKSTDVSKIQQKIAGAGYDNEGVMATDEAYEKLHSCCKYERLDPKDKSTKKEK